MTAEERNTNDLTVQEFAERAGVHTNTVYRAIRRGWLVHKVIRQGFYRQTYLIPASELPADAKAAA